MMGRTVALVLVTGPDRETLAALGRTVVSEQLAACVNIVADVRSIYRWEGRIEDETEALALFKTSRDRVEELEARVRELHAYDEPEVLALEVDAGSRSYIEWVVGSVTGPDEQERAG